MKSIKKFINTPLNRLEFIISYIGLGIAASSIVYVLLKMHAPFVHLATKSIISNKQFPIVYIIGALVFLALTYKRSLDLTSPKMAKIYTGTMAALSFFSAALEYAAGGTSNIKPTADMGTFELHSIYIFVIFIGIVVLIFKKGKNSSSEAATTTN